MCNKYTQHGSTLAASPVKIFCGHTFCSDHATKKALKGVIQTALSSIWILQFTVSEIPTIGTFKQPIRLHSRAGKTF